jgi:hypothetical protein
MLCADTAMRLRSLCSHLSDDEFERFVLEVALKTLCFDLGLSPRAEQELRGRFESTLASPDPIRIPKELLADRGRPADLPSAKPRPHGLSPDP